MNSKRIWAGRLESIAFVSGFVLMVFELAGARILAPSIGSSTYVWTSVIGVIIAALSTGYWVGGKIADARGYLIDIARLCLAIAIAITYVLVVYGSLLQWVAESFDDPRTQGVIASLLLFAPTSFLLGMLSPYLAKLNVRSLKTAGRSIASLSALNSLGGIVGTFVAGFVLFGYVGSHETFSIIALAMVGLSWLITPSVQWRLRLGASVIVLILMLLSQTVARGISIDTPSARYTIFETQDNGKTMRGISTGPQGVQSGVYVDDPSELVFWYTQQMANIVADVEAREDILILGGGAFTLPQHLAQKYPNSSIDVVEIDPKLADVARQYFNYSDPSNVTLIFDDARKYLNQTSKQYDIIIVDVYGDTFVPFSLMTREYGDRIDRAVKKEGIVVTNIIASLHSSCGVLLNALDAPYRAHFPYAAYTARSSGLVRSNIVVSYSRTPYVWPNAAVLGLETRALYSDNHTPADRLQYDCRRQQ